MNREIKFRVWDGKNKKWFSEKVLNRLPVDVLSLIVRLAAKPIGHDPHHAHKLAIIKAIATLQTQIIEKEVELGTLEVVRRICPTCGAKSHL